MNTTGFAVTRRGLFGRSVCAGGAADRPGFGGYETWPARSSYSEVQAEAEIRAAVLELLKQAGI